MDLDLDIYEKQEILGEGSFGKVFKVKDKMTGEIFAAKISLTKISKNDKQQITNIEREVNIMAQLNHPSILKFIGFNRRDFNNKSKPVIITEYCSNGTLKDILNLSRKDNSPSQWNATKKLINIFGIASAMTFLHSHNVIHRDLKPENILEDDYLFPKVSDFGLSKIKHKNESSISDESSKGFKGTCIYAAPEIHRDYNYTKSGDVYSFSLIMYEIITLKKPYKKFDYFKFLIKVCNENYRPKIPSSVPICYKNMMEKCWSNELEERPTFEQIVEELEKNEEFITNEVNKEEYYNYIELIKNSITSFDHTKKFKKIIISKPRNKKKDKDEWKDYLDHNEYYNKDAIVLQKSSDEINKSSIFFNLDEISKSDIIKNKNIQIRQRSDFEINNKIIGKGSFGFVRVAIDKLDGQKVAFKEMYPSVDENENKQILKEIKMMSKFNHYSIQNLYGYIEEDLDDFRSSVILTLFEENDSLEKFIQKNSTNLDFTSKYIIMYGIAAGLSYLHDKNIIHGKLNPKSILINKQNEPKITNFDQSKIAQNDQIFQSILNSGETIYIAPELIKMEDDMFISIHNAKMLDVYNFSLIIFYIFTGERPWSNIKQTIILPSKIIEGERPNFPSNFPKLLKLLIQICWKQNPTERPSFSTILSILRDEQFYTNLGEKIDLERFNEYESKVSTSESENIYQNEVFINGVGFPKIPNKKYISSDKYNKINNTKEEKSFFNITEIRMKNQSEKMIYNLIQIKKEYSNNADVLELYSSQIQVLLSIDHPALIQLYGCYRIPSKIFNENFQYNSLYNYFPEYNELPDLIVTSTKRGNLLSNIHNLDITEKYIILYGIASAMSYLHNKNIMHLNLNPENILLNDEFEPIIKIDITCKIENKSLDIFTLLSEFSYSYVAPELLYDENIVNNNEQLKLCDVYSFAMICYFYFQEIHLMVKIKIFK